MKRSLTYHWKEVIRRIRHELFGCRKVLIGWSFLQNPIRQCPICGQCYVTYGSINTRDTPISLKKARMLLGELDDDTPVGV